MTEKCKSVSPNIKDAECQKEKGHTGNHICSWEENNVNFEHWW